MSHPSVGHRRPIVVARSREVSLAALATVALAASAAACVAVASSGTPDGHAQPTGKAAPVRR
jgi:hypothetical protein